MESKKINQLATELAPDLSDLTIIGDPTTGISKKITLSQMASLFTGTVEEYATLAAFPLVGVADTIYIAKDTNVIYRWDSTAYVVLSPNVIASLVFNDANGFDGTISLVGSIATLTITTALTSGSVPFIGASGALTQDNANLFFDDTNNRLGIATASPTTALDVFGSGIIGRINGTSTNNAYLGFSSAGTNKWSVGNVQSDHRFRIFSEANSAELVSVLQTGEFGIGINNPTTKFHIDGAASALIANLDANVSVAKSLSYRSDNSARINLEVSGTESGSNVGADFFLRTFTDAGSLIETPFTIVRSTGVTTIKSLTLTNALAATSGGTGQSSYAIGDILYASTTTALSKLADVATGNALISGGVGVAPSWGKIALTTHVSGILPVANGGTGSATQNFVDLTTTQTIAGAKTFSNAGVFSSTLTINGASTLTTLNVIGSGANGILLDQDSASVNASSRLFFKMSTQTYSILADTNGLNFASGATAGSSSGSTKMTISSAGVITFKGDGPSLIQQALTVGSELYFQLYNSAGSRRAYIGYGSNNTSVLDFWNAENGDMKFGTNNTEKVRITSGGLLGIGGTPTTKFELFGSLGNFQIASSGAEVFFTRNDNNDFLANGGSSAGIRFGAQQQLRFATGTSLTTRLTIDVAGNIIKATDNTTTGQIQYGGQTGSPPNAILVGAADQNGPYPIGVKSLSNPTSQGLVGFFDYTNASQGSISISGTTVSYNSFMGSHWSQLSDNSKPEILKGTVLEAIDELCEWENEVNDRLAKIKISDTIESKNVYGVFLDWDNMDKLNDMYVAAVGAGFIRVNSTSIVSMGDLLQSNGDGTAKVQLDDIMRSSTIAKVTSTQKIETYEDGSYLIAATLHCG